MVKIRMAPYFYVFCGTLLLSWKPMHIISINNRFYYTTDVSINAGSTLREGVYMYLTSFGTLV